MIPEYAPIQQGKTANARAKTSKLRTLVRRTDFSVAVATIALYFFFSVSTDAFFTTFNQFNLLRTAGLYVFVALSQGMLQVTGGTSLSIGAAGVFSGMFACMAMENLGMPIWVGVVIALAVAMVTGFLTGFVVCKLKLPAFVVTLAIQYILNGLVQGITHGYPFTHLPENITAVGRAGIGVFPLVTILAILTLTILWYVFRYTVFGRRILAIGGNMEAARLSGIASDTIYLWCSVLSGFFSGLSAMLWISRAGTMQATLGADWMMVSFSVSMLGASKAGFISPVGFFFSAVLIALIKNGLVVANVNVYFENVFLGIIVLFAVSIDSIRNLINQRSKKL